MGNSTTRICAVVERPFFLSDFLGGYCFKKDQRIYLLTHPGESNYLYLPLLQRALKIEAKEWQFIQDRITPLITKEIPDGSDVTEDI